MIECSFETFFKTAPDEIRHLFEDKKPVWTPLQGGLKEFFKSLPKENKIEGTVSEFAHLDGEQIIIEKGAVVEATAYIKGPCYISKGTEVRHGAYLRGNVFIGQNCVVGHSTEVKHSIFFHGAKAGHFNYIGDSILGNNINLGAGTKIANLKMLAGTVKLKVNDESIDTELKKLGAVMGDESQTGCNSVLNPGTFLPPKSLVFPCVSASGFHTKRVKLTK